MKLGAYCLHEGEEGISVKRSDVKYEIGSLGQAKNKFDWEVGQK